MLNNYFITALRNLLRHRLFSAINIVGLAIGLASVILIILFVRDEVGHDQWIPEHDRIARIHMSYVPNDGRPFETVRSAGRMRQALSDMAPEFVESSVRLIFDRPTVVKDGQSYAEQVAYADSSFFEVFDLPLLRGDRGSAMAEVDNLVISETMARKYFGDINVVGETLTFCCLNGEKVTAKISAVLKDLPRDTHFDINFLLVIEPSRFAFAPNLLDTWGSVNVYTYFKMKKAKGIPAFQEKISRWLDDKSPFQEMLQGSKVTDVLNYRVMPVADIHLRAISHAGNSGGLKPLGDLHLVYAYMGIALLVLIIASINFMNLSTARSSSRAREVALRKVVGASRRQVATQFLSESVFLCLISFVLALALVELTLPFYNEMLGKKLALDYGDVGFLLALLILSMVVGVLGGAYPAFFLSGFRPASILKANQSSTQGGNRNIRSYLVIFQFAASICLVTCTAIVYSQTDFARSLDLGYDITNKLVLRNVGADGSNLEPQVLKNRLLALPEITQVTYSSEVPSDDRNNNTGFRRLSAGAVDSGMGDQVTLNYHTLDHDFIEIYDINLLAGRSFSDAFTADTVHFPEEDGALGTGAIMLNESAMRKLGYKMPQEAIGQVIRGNLFQLGEADMTIIGVIPDVYFRSIKFGIRPSVYFRRTDGFNNATVQFTTEDLPGLIRKVEEIWKEMEPMVPFRYDFVNELVVAQYAAEDAKVTLFAAFATLAIIIACLGLYGLASFSAEQRTKEIGIRKVLGATVFDIIRLLVWEFSKPVIIANIIAWPLAWYFMTDYLTGFEYRISLSPVYFIGAGLGALVIAWATVTWHAAQVASAKPIKALRYE
ncbi:FtsX-like permease family protein [Paremcibacter congregatus]|uniref:FtsX-like permease family protein n=1 Tax=Paremcibacter congregatus TaxID=2043170 RepID=UPI0030EC0884|tara:strand:+ start:2615 stop:5113 length:2499 start_codon:yes stop_codon:yes gene_type:complete